tara:strand:- start:1552 stop:2319 length:768 start_codon:yes stop_codon:yes gene_type:complete
MISPLQITIYFSLITLGYFIIKFMLCETYSQKKEGKGVMACRIITAIYLATILAIQFIANYQIVLKKCGEPQFAKTITYTLGPNLIIFGGLMTLLTVFPGWKAPFSNTIGYVILNGLGKLIMGKGIGDALLAILKKDNTNKLLKKVYADPSMMVNDITPDNFNVFIQRLGGNNSIKKSDVSEEDLATLYNFVVLKDNIASFVWYFLTGLLVIQNSNSYIQTMKCVRSETQLAKNFRESKVVKADKDDRKWKIPAE